LIKAGFFMNKLAVGLAGLGLLIGGCGEKYRSQVKTYTPKVVEVSSFKIPESKMSYKLEDLCDTKVDMKDITLYLNFKRDEIFDRIEYRMEFEFGIKDFFLANNVNCNIEYTSDMKGKYTDPNKFYLRVSNSTTSFARDYRNILTNVQGKVIDDQEACTFLFDKGGFAVTETGISIVNSRMSGLEGIYLGEGLSDLEAEKKIGNVSRAYAKKDAVVGCHEVLHCMGLFHPRTLSPSLVDLNVGGVPNMMMRGPGGKYSWGGARGYTLDDNQKKLMHSFIAGNNTYKAFEESNHDLWLYVQRLDRDN
jgi:hypothetical protein